MTSHRLTIAATLLVSSVPLVAPATAGANPLLSGYGGPGEGNQAILGSGLVGGPSGGGGPGAGSGSTGAAGLQASDAAGTTAGGSGLATRGSGASARGAHADGAASGSRGQGKHGRAGAAAAAGARATPPARAFTPAAATGSEGGSQTLGLSGADFLYIAVALVALLVIGALTRGFAREPRLRRESG
jgi:hypothetical protein